MDDAMTYVSFDVPTRPFVLPGIPLPSFRSNPDHSGFDRGWLEWTDPGAPPVGSDRPGTNQIRSRVHVIRRSARFETHVVGKGRMDPFHPLASVHARRGEPRTHQSRGGKRERGRRRGRGRTHTSVVSIRAVRRFPWKAVRADRSWESLARKGEAFRTCHPSTHTIHTASTDVPLVGNGREWIRPWRMRSLGRAHGSSLSRSSGPTRTPSFSRAGSPRFTFLSEPGLIGGFLRSIPVGPSPVFHVAFHPLLRSSPSLTFDETPGRPSNPPPFTDLIHDLTFRRGYLS
eukprot:scaffold73_cov337-Pavlova_lutheri.AAC.53